MDSASPFAVGSRQDPSGTPVVHVAGEIDMATADELRAAIAGAVSQDGSGVVIDLREVTFLDSTGLSTLLAADEDARRRGGGMTLIVADGPVSRLLEMTGAGAHLDVREGDAAP